MLKIKLFEGSDASELETEVNEWLQEHLNIDVVHMTQSESAIPDEDGEFWGNTTISLMYRLNS